MQVFWFGQYFPSQAKLDTFRDLPVGWHYGSGGPIPNEIIDRAKRVITELAFRGFTHTDVFPNEGGEVLVAAYHLSHYLGIGVELSGYTLNHEKDGNDVYYAESLSMSDLSAELGKIAHTIWNTSDFSTPRSLTIAPGDSTTWRSSAPATEAECRWSNWSALPLLATA